MERKANPARSTPDWKQPTSAALSFGAEKVTELERRVITLLPNNRIWALIDGKLPSDADIGIFADMVRTAAYFYLEDRAVPTSAEMRAETAQLVRAAKKAAKEIAKPSPQGAIQKGRWIAASRRKLAEAVRTYSNLSEQTRRALTSRAERRGVTLPSADEILGVSEAPLIALRQIISLTTMGGYWHKTNDENERANLPGTTDTTLHPDDDIVEASGSIEFDEINEGTAAAGLLVASDENPYRKSDDRQWWVDIIYASRSPKSPPKREEVRAFIQRVRASWRWSIAEGRAAAKAKNEQERQVLACEIERMLNEPPRTCAPETPSAFAEFLIECSTILGMKPKVDIVGVLNDIARSEAKKAIFSDQLSKTLAD